jgi:uncharacterized protein with PIN domain
MAKSVYVSKRKLEEQIRRLRGPHLGYCSHCVREGKIEMKPVVVVVAEETADPASSMIICHQCIQEMMRSQ